MSGDASYVALHSSGELAERARVLLSLYRACTVCPRRCGIDRTSGKTGGCFSGETPAVASHTAHFGEEPPISGERGSGTIFFANCPLHCVFCQNWQISQMRGDARRAEVSHERLAEIMLELQSQDCHNINLVSPTHFVPSIVAALDIAAAQGLRIPLVYNTNGYDSLQVLRLLDGVVDIYLPDIKYADARTALRLSKVRDYPLHARAAIEAMYRQVGDLELDDEGVALRGLLIRHLVLPEDLSGSLESLRWIAEQLSPNVYLSVMAQYYPTNISDQYPPLHRRLRFRECERVTDALESLGLLNGWVQSHHDAPDTYCPDFNRDQPFER